MAKGKRRNKRKGTEDSSPRSSSQATSDGQTAGAIAAQLLARPMGVSNVGRMFDSTERHNGPHMALRIHESAFKYGFSSSAGMASQDPQAAINDLLTYNDPLYAVTPCAKAFIQEYWPILDSLLQSGTGTRYPVSSDEIVRYFAFASEAIELLMVPLTLNYLSTIMKWEMVAPYTSSIPPCVWGLVDMFDAGDVGIVDRWKPLYERLAVKVFPPSFKAALMENCNPYVGNVYGHVLQMNVPQRALNVPLGVDTLEDYYDVVVSRLTYLEKNLRQTHNVLASFLPFFVGGLVSAFRGFDPMTEELNFNGTTKWIDNFGDTGDPTNEYVITCGDASENGDSVIFYHKGAAPQLKTIVMTDIYRIISDIDDEYMNLSCWRGGPILLPDDELALIYFDGGVVTTEAAQRVQYYVPNRFQKRTGDQSLLEGVGKAGYLPALLAREEIERANRAYANWLFGTRGLKAVLSISGGSSVRVIRREVAEAWQANR